jgi:hypothetical protein
MRIGAHPAVDALDLRITFLASRSGCGARSTSFQNFPGCRENERVRRFVDHK